MRTEPVLKRSRRILRLGLAVLFVLVSGCDNGEASPDPEADAGPDAAPSSEVQFDGRTMGRVVGDNGTETGIALNGVAVFLRAAGAEDRLDMTTTDGDGRYELPPQRPGTYEVCAEQTGFEPTCHAEPVVVEVGGPYEMRDLRLVPTGAAVAGVVELAGGDPCAHDSVAFGTTLRATVRLVEESGGELLAETVANAEGRFMLAGLPSEGVLEADCEAASATMPWTALLGGVGEVRLTVDNHRPFAGALMLETLAGEPLRLPRGGQAVQLFLEARDEDDDPLRYRFVDGHGDAFVAADARATLALSDAGQVLLLGEVSDGRGGYRQASMMVRTQAESYVAGHVRGPGGEAVSDAVVRLGDQETRTDGDGLFRFLVNADPPYQLTADAEGMTSTRRVLDAPSSELRLVLQPETRATVEVGRRATIQEARGLAAVHFPENAIANAGGPLTVAVAGYDPRRPVDIPGRPIAEVGGVPTSLQLIAAMSVELWDGDAPATLAPRRTAELIFPALEPAPGERLPPELPLYSYDEASELWVAEGTARLEGTSYRAAVTHFSVWSLALEVGAEEACVRVDVPQDLMGQVVIRAVVNRPSVAGGVVANEWVPSQTINVVRHLPPFTAVTIHAVSVTDSENVLWSQSANTQNPIFNPPLYWPYVNGNDGCNGWVRLERPLVPRPRFLDRFMNTAEEGEMYYAMLGLPADLTLSQWKASWGFTAQDEADALAFYNPQEFGLGRRAVCHTRGSTPDDIEMACCVAKYGHVGGSVHEALEDTVADVNVGDTVCMEWSPGPSGERFAKFLAFTPEGDLSPITYFDISGPRALPSVCGHCHGRTQDWAENEGDMGGRFVFFDAPAYDYAGWDPEWTLAAQQERFRVLNENVRTIHRNEGPYADYIDSLYRGGVDVPGSTAAEAEPLLGWAGQRQTYQDVLRPNCRTCHIWQTAPMNFEEPTESIGEIVSSRICSGEMPQAMQPTLNLWGSYDPFLGDALSAAFDAPYCFSDDQPPLVEILEPTSSVSVPIGGFFGLRLRAQTNDAEDGPGCCTVTWSSDLDGTLGVGHEIYGGLSTPGTHVITVTARDSRFRVSSATVQVTARNDPPMPQVRFPEADLDSLYRTIPYVLHGEASDANQPLGVPCESLRWTSSSASDTGLFPVSGCFPELTFTSNGQRTLTLTATDASRTEAMATRTINVPDPPLNAPPIVTVLSPTPATGYQGTAALQVRASVVDPDGGSVSWQVFARRSGGSNRLVDSGTCAPGTLCRPTFDWIPENSLGRNCGGYPAVLTVRGTDPDGAGEDTVSFSVAFPPC